MTLCGNIKKRCASKEATPALVETALFPATWPLRPPQMATANRWQGQPNLHKPYLIIVLS